MAVEIVGREDEVAALHAFLDGADGGARALVLEGEAGIGKSTLWAAGVEAAQERSFRVLSARPAEAEQGLAHAALGDLLADCAAEVLPELSAPRRRALQAALLLDEDGGSLADPRALAVAVHSALLVLAERGPTVIAVDDVQWLDSSSADALSFALRRLDGVPISVLLARRGAQAAPLEHALPGDVERRSVGPLSLGATQGLVRDRLGRSFPRPTMVRLHEVSGGNPFYALELARALDTVSAPLDPAAPLPVPDSLEHLVGDRLRSLPDETRAALLVVAVVGAPALELIEAAGISEQTLAPAVAEQVLEYTGLTMAGPVEMPGDEAALVALNEVTVHAWDLAVATGQPYDPDPAAVESCQSFVAAFDAPTDGSLFAPRRRTRLLRRRFLQAAVCRSAGRRR